MFGMGLIPMTWFFFGPIAGFHHMFAFGITGYLLLNGEDPQLGDHIWGEYAVYFSPKSFVVGFVLWALCVFILFRLLTALTKRWRAVPSEH